MDENAAIELCVKHGDPRGFEHLVHRHRRQAYIHAVSLMGNAEDAADACQESFARAFAAIRRLDGLTQFYPWFYRILRNCCLNAIARRRTAEKYRDAVEQGAAGPGALDALVRADENARVWRLLARLKAEFREILLLKYVDGCSYAQLAERLEIPRGTVMSRLYHARRAFRDLFAESEEEQ